MYSSPAKTKAATVGARSTKNDDATAHSKHPEDPTWTHTGAGLFVELRNGRKFLVQPARITDFNTAYKAATTPGERNAVVRKFGKAF